jgi:hypothetical protein
MGTQILTLLLDAKKPPQPTAGGSRCKAGAGVPEPTNVGADAAIRGVDA